MELFILWQFSKLLPMIAEKQNLPENIKSLKAQRQMYSEAKRLLGWQFVLIFFFPITINIITQIFPTAKIASAVWVIVMIVLDSFLFSPLLKVKKETAAKIQEMFVTNVLGLPWNTLKGEKIDLDVVELAMERYDEKERKRGLKPKFTSIQNWYSNSIVSKPDKIARIQCQQEDLWWDNELRERYHKSILWIICIVMLIIVLTGLLKDMPLKDILLYVVFPLFPMFTLLIREYTTHQEATKKIARLKDYAKKLEELARQMDYPDDKLLIQSRCLQDEIFEHRKNAPLIWDWLFKILEKQYNKRATKKFQ